MASEKTFSDTIVDAVCRQFEDNPQLEGVAQIIETPIEGDIDEEMFCNVLCHKAIIILNVVERRVF